MKKIIILYGPTAVGKSDFAQDLAARFDGEIINADIGSFYTPLTIGTAKPAWQAGPIPHHMFDILDEPKNYTVVAYRERVIKVVEDITARGKTPIVVGGSGFYIQSLLFPPAPGLQKKQLAQEIPKEKRWQMLLEKDPARAQMLHPHDMYRITQALDIFLSTGSKASLHKPTYRPIAPFVFIELVRDRAALYERINERVNVMLNAGWIEEVRSLLNTEWEPFLRQKKLIGYDDIIDFLQGTIATREILVATIAQKTRNYAKRQISFGKMLARQILAHQQINHAADDVVKKIVMPSQTAHYHDLNNFINSLE